MQVVKSKTRDGSSARSSRACAVDSANQAVARATRQSIKPRRCKKTFHLSTALDSEKESNRSVYWIENILEVAIVELWTEEADYATGSPAL